MNNQYPRCCERSPSFLIEFKISSRTFQVCQECSQLPHYSREIKNKIPFSEITGQAKPQTTAEMEGVIV